MQDSAQDFSSLGGKAGELIKLAPPTPSPSLPSEPLTLSRSLVSLTMTERTDLNHNTRLFRFALPSPEHRLGLPCGKHLFVRAVINGEPVLRAYTPISGDDDLGKLDLLIKVGDGGGGGSGG